MEAITARNILAIFVCFSNGVRSYNLMKMSIYDFEKDTLGAEFGAYVLKTNCTRRL